MSAITDVPGLLVGHTTRSTASTGCTVLLGPKDGMRGAVHVRGRATGTRELDALSPRHLVPGVHAILLTGGSAFGLGAADGVMKWLAERNRGFPVGAGVVPIVPAAVIFDLSYGAAEYPDAADGYQACETAGVVVTEGSVGVGTGATVGKVLGASNAMKGGVGTWSVVLDDLVAGGLVVVNAFGDVRGGSGEIIAGARTESGFADSYRYLADGGEPGGSFAQGGANTTLVIAATNGDLTRIQLKALAQMAADALTRRISPVGTLFDGDVAFAVSTGEVPVKKPLALELMAQEAVMMAVERAVRLAVGTSELPGLAGP